MTPAAVTPAGRSGSAGHRRKLRDRLAPGGPRRVSGPLSGRRQETATGPAPRTARTAAPRPATSPLPRPAPGRARPVPARRSRTARRAVPRHRQRGSFGPRVASFVRALPDHQLLDRIIRGRAWIPILGVLLAGIVAMQVEVLKLSASIGRSIERSSALTIQNGELQESVATLADDQRIERLAAQMGMVMPAPDAIDFLSAQPGGNAAQAVTNVHAPDASGFLAQLPSITETTADGNSATAIGPTSASAMSGPGADVSPGTADSSGTAVSATDASAPATAVGSDPATAADGTSATSPSSTGSTGTGAPSAPATSAPLPQSGGQQGTGDGLAQASDTGAAAPQSAPPSTQTSSSGGP